MTPCACPNPDAQRCAEARYPRFSRGDRFETTEPCECSCHDEDGDEEVLCQEQR